MTGITARRSLSLVALAPLAGLALLTGLAALGCAALRPPAVPMRTVEIAAGGDGRCLAVLLPGRRDAPERFARAGFAAAVAARGLPLDLIAADAHLGYYRSRTVIDRLRLDVVAPAQAAGYDEIWMVGVSLGGTGSLLYLRDHPEDLAGVLALAPFLGADGVIRDIEAAGGPAAWKPPADPAGDDVGRELWRWLVPFTQGDATVPLYLGWGAADGFDRSNRLLAGLLPAERVLADPGGHDWDAWERLWEQFLDRAAPCGGG